MSSQAVRDSAGALLADLRELDLNGGAAAETALVLALETAEGSRGPCEGAGSQLVSESACSVVSTLMASDAAFAKWQDKHKKMIKGSARVLQHLAEAQPPKLAELLSSPEKATLFSKLLCEIRGRHRLYLETGKGWQVMLSIL